MNKRVDHFNTANAPSASLPLNRIAGGFYDARTNSRATDDWAKSPSLVQKPVGKLAHKRLLKKRFVWERPVGPELAQVNLGVLNQKTAPLNASFVGLNRSTPRVPLPLPLMGCSVAAGFPSPAEDWIEGSLDLNSHLIPRPSSTFLFRVSGTSMINAGIMAGALLVVDRAIEPRHGAIVVAHINGELTVKRLYKRGGTTRLDAENPTFPPLVFRQDEEISIWGVVSHAVVSF